MAGDFTDARGKRRDMRDTDRILDFMVRLSREAIRNGASIEYAISAMRHIAASYELNDLSVFALSSYISVSAEAPGGEHRTRQITVPEPAIHLARLWRLNRLSLDVCEEVPDPASLDGRLNHALEAPSYPKPAVFMGQVIAISCVCMILGGTVGDAFATGCSALVVCVIFDLLERWGIDRIIGNAVGMWAGTSLAIMLVRAGIGDSNSMVVISVSLLMIPGIPLVNAVGNLVRGNELNGTYQLMRVTLESLMLALGTYAGVTMMGGMAAW